MTANSEATLKVLAYFMSTYRHPWCIPSQKKILECLKKYHKNNISRRTLNRVLKWLVAYGYITRIKRHYRGKDNMMVFRSTCYVLQGKLIGWLGKMKSFLTRILDFLRVPSVAQYRIITETRYTSVPVIQSYVNPETAKNKEFSIKLEIPPYLDIIQRMEKLHPELV